MKVMQYTSGNHFSKVRLAAKRASKTLPKMIVASISLVVFASQALATDLMDVYLQSLENDPVFKAAYSTLLANREAVPQARAALLPQLTGAAQAARNVINVTASNFSVEQTFNSNQLQLTVSQTIFNYQNWAKVQQAKASVKAAHATFNDAAQDLILRTSKTYFDALLARDTLNFAEAKLRANKRQLEQAQQRFNVGLDAITSVYEAKAAYDQSIAQVISAKNNQINQNENLRKLTNHTYEHLSPLRNNRIPLVTPEPNNADEWIATGIKQNYKLLSAKYSLQAARETIKAQTAGNWPTFSLESSSNKTSNSVGGAGASNFFVPSSRLNSNVAIAMNFPMYQGGLVESQTRQAKFEFQTTSEQLEQTYRDVVVNSQIAFNTIVDGISKVKADRQTVVSQQNSLESTEAQFQVGTRTMVDVVNAQQRLFEAQEQLATDQYGLVNAILNLKYLAGTLSVTDIEEINSWLNTTRINDLPGKKPLTKTTK